MKIDDGVHRAEGGTEQNKKINVLQIEWVNKLSNCSDWSDICNSLTVHIYTATETC